MKHLLHECPIQSKYIVNINHCNCNPSSELALEVTHKDKFVISVFYIKEQLYVEYTTELSLPFKTVFIVLLSNKLKNSTQPKFNWNIFKQKSFTSVLVHVGC